MQWLIDLVVERVLQECLLGRFVRRSAVSTDWDFVDLIANAQWHELNCDSVVPEGASAIVFNQFGNAAVVSAAFYLRYPGDHHWENTPGLIMQVADISTSRVVIVGCDGNRILEYRMSNVTWLAHRLHVLGWFL